MQAFQVYSISCHVKFLGHMVSEEGISTDPDKNASVRNCQRHGKPRKSEVSWDSVHTIAVLSVILHRYLGPYTNFLKRAAYLFGPVNVKNHFSLSHKL